MTFGTPFLPLHPQSVFGSTMIDPRRGHTQSQASGASTPPSLEFKTVAELNPAASSQQTTSPPLPFVPSDVPISIENVSDDDPPLSRVFVRCSQSLTKDELQDLFSQYGEVQQLKLITIKATNKFKGKLFVKYAKASSAALAVEELNGKEVKGSALTVQLAESYRTSVERRAMMVDEADYPPFSRLFITCPPHLTYQELHKIFSEFGGVQHIVLLKDKYTQASRGLGFVKYSTASAASLAAVHFSKQRERKDAPPILCRIANPRSSHRNQKSSPYTPDEVFYEREADACYGETSDNYCFDAQQETPQGFAEQASEASKHSLLEYFIQLVAKETGFEPTPQQRSRPHRPVAHAAHLASSASQNTEFQQVCDCEECLTSALLTLLANPQQYSLPTHHQLSDDLLSQQIASLTSFDYQGQPAQRAIASRTAQKPPRHQQPHFQAYSPTFHQPHSSIPPPVTSGIPATHPVRSPKTAHAASIAPVPPYPLPIQSPAGFPPVPLSVGPGGASSAMSASTPSYPLVSPIVTSGPFPPDSRLFITFARQLPPEVLQEVFGQYGTLAYAYLLHDRNYGFVQYYTAASAQLAIEALNNRSVSGVPCRVMIADPYTKKKASQHPVAPSHSSEEQDAIIKRLAEILVAHGNQNITE